MSARERLWSTALEAGNVPEVVVKREDLLAILREDSTAAAFVAKVRATVYEYERTMVKR